MMELTKERLQEIESVLSAGALGYSVERDEVLTMARQLLASMEQEPVAWVTMQKEFCDDERTAITNSVDADRYSRSCYDLTPLYAAPQLPQPAVVDNASREDFEAWARDAGFNEDWYFFTNVHPNHYDDDHINDMWAAWSACRAAMLQGAEPVSQPDELPMDYQQGHKDGLEWAARLAEANHPQTGDWFYDDPLELAKAIRKGPDMPTASVQGWIPCSERMPEEIGRYWCYVEEQNSLGKSHYQWNCSWNGDRWWVESENGGRVTHWMPLPAAPQQEADNG